MRAVCLSHSSKVYLRLACILLLDLTSMYIPWHVVHIHHSCVISANEL